ncbi:MAG: hypothetical protein Kow0068_14360 [Marinilabiliales bacterium]
MKSRKKYTIEEIITKIKAYCSNKEVCKKDVRQKLTSWDVKETDTEKIISNLISEGFIDEKRYAKAFVHDKFYLNKWGKNKIKYSLLSKGIKTDLINDAIDIIDDDEYIKVMEDLMVKKLLYVKEKDRYHLKAKLLSFISNRGFETDIAIDVIDKILKSN